MKLAIIVPYRDRKKYLNAFLQLFPDYLEKNDIFDYKIFICEQADDTMFNIGISRNVGAIFAQSQDNYDYFIFNDVDIAPISGVDLSYSDENLIWFMNGGGCKLPVKAFNNVCGFNTLYNGWGCEEIDFWHRLCKLDKMTKTWINTPECKKARIVNMDMSIKNTEESYHKSKEYFGVEGPLYVPFPMSPIHKEKFFTKNVHNRNKQILDLIYTFNHTQLRDYVELFGSKQVDISKIEVKQESKKVCHLEYNKVNVLFQS